MKLEVKDSSPDGMEVHLETFVMTWEELKDFIDHIAAWENRHCNSSKPIGETKS